MLIYKPGLNLEEVQEVVREIASSAGYVIDLIAVPNGTVDPRYEIITATSLLGARVRQSALGVTAGTLTLDLQVGGVTVLSGLFNLLTLTANTLTALTFASAPVALAAGAVVKVIVTSNNADLSPVPEDLYVTLEF